MRFPIVDVSAAGAPAAIDAACREIGFFAVVGHGLPSGVVEDAWRAATAFFDLPLEKKLRSRSEAPDYPYGFFPIEDESLGHTAPPDLNESFNLGPPPRPEVAAAGGFALTERLWPESPVEMRPTWTGYYAAMEELAGRLMRLFAQALGLDERFFDDKVDRHLSALRALNYPEQVSAPAPGQIRAAEHTDYGTLTILKPGQATGGLEVLTTAGAWLHVPHVEQGFVVNIGDLMQVWTNDRWRSTLHRVVNPDDAVAASERRQSMAFFHQPNWDARIECLPSCTDAENPPRHPPTQSGPWLRSRVEAAHDHSDPFPTSTRRSP